MGMEKYINGLKQAGSVGEADGNTPDCLVCKQFHNIAKYFVGKDFQDASATPTT